MRLTADVAEILEIEIKDLLAAGVAIKRPFLVNEKTKRAYSESVFNKACREILDRIGYPELRVTYLRHTVITELEEAGVDDAGSAAIVGHSPSSHRRLKERHYRITTDEQSDRGIARLEALRQTRKWVWNKERMFDARL